MIDVRDPKEKPIICLPLFMKEAECSRSILGVKKKKEKAIKYSLLVLERIICNIFGERKMFLKTKLRNRISCSLLYLLILVRELKGNISFVLSFSVCLRDYSYFTERYIAV